MTTITAARRFLFLQGPHGPFFGQLGRMLGHAGAQVMRIGFNGGDRAFWPRDMRYLAYRGRPEDWPAACALWLAEHAITDLVIYGDTRPLHAEAVDLARNAGLTVHVFEEGYLRPYWITYERSGSNGHSRLMRLSLADMRAALAEGEVDMPEAPARWGDLRQHVFYGALYHWIVLVWCWRYRSYRPHRDITLLAEFRLHLRRLALMPLHRIERQLATRRIQRGAFAFHLVLLQLEHDANFRAHGPFATLADFVAACIAGFAAGAPAHHHLVFKAHPLEDGRVPLARDIRRLARLAGIGGRVHFVRGGKLARLLDDARSAVTVNSTAAHQALWRGLPLRAFGAAIYAKPDFVSQQTLPGFFAQPDPPDRAGYRDFRRFLLETSQVAGGFYAARARRRLLRRVTDMVLARQDPYEALCRPDPPLLHPLRVVS